MKVRIRPKGIGLMPRFSVQEKKWWGWKTLYNAEILSYCIKYIEDLSTVRKVDWIKD